MEVWVFKFCWLIRELELVSRFLFFFFTSSLLVCRLVRLCRAVVFNWWGTGASLTPSLRLLEFSQILAQLWQSRNIRPDYERCEQQTQPTLHPWPWFLKISMSECFVFVGVWRTDGVFFPSASITHSNTQRFCCCAHDWHSWPASPTTYKLVHNDYIRHHDNSIRSVITCSVASLSAKKGEGFHNLTWWIVKDKKLQEC